MSGLRTHRDIPVKVAGEWIYCDDGQHVMSRKGNTFYCPKKGDDYCGRVTVDQFIDAYNKDEIDFTDEIDDLAA